MSQASSTTEIHTDTGISNIVEAVYPYDPEQADEEIKKEMQSMSYEQSQTANILENFGINIEGAAWVGLVVLAVVAYLIYNKKTKVGATVFSWSRVYDDIKKRFRKDKEGRKSVGQALGRKSGRSDAGQQHLGGDKGGTSEHISSSADSGDEKLQKKGDKVGTDKSGRDGDEPREPKARFKKD